jgi:LPPG:FO 2-phospho-L-lactate transferase
MEIAALAGGIGGSKLLGGLCRVMDPEKLTIIVNTGDDIVMHGLYISPDLDTVTYTLAGVANPETGWGLRDETFHTFRQLAKFGHQSWFNLGDRDLATHIHRTAMLHGGASLSQASDSIRKAMGVRATVLPMCDEPVPTMVNTDQGRLHFQEYLVQRHAEPVIQSLEFAGIERAKPAPGVVETIERASRFVICPSNPLISIGPILAVPGIREALRKRRADTLGVCPIVGGKSLKGPSDRMLAQLGFDVSALGVARMYEDICSTFVIDSADAGQREAIERLNMQVVVTSTVMRTDEEKNSVARQTLLALEASATKAGAGSRA